MTGKDFDKLLDEYFDRFGENYPIVITSSVNFDDCAKQIRKCIESGKKAPAPEYEDKAVY